MYRAERDKSTQEHDESRDGTHHNMTLHESSGNRFNSSPEWDAMQRVRG